MRKHLLIAGGLGFVSLGVLMAATTALDRPDEKTAGAPTGARRAAVTHATSIHTPLAPPAVDTGELDAHGRPVLANCTTCHATRTPNARTVRGDHLTEFHLGLTMQHGELTCLSCHNRDNYEQLRRADGRPLDFPMVMQLCAQCHGPQYRDYQHGAHGGMNGYWDLTRGPRYRNNCIDCHNPHAPQYPRVRPVLSPKDRFMSHDRTEDVGHE